MAGNLARWLGLAEDPEEATYLSADPEAGEPSEHARTTLAPLTAADKQRLATSQPNTSSAGYSIDPLPAGVKADSTPEEVRAALTAPVQLPRPAAATAPRAGPLAGRGKTAPISTPPTYESLAALAPGGDAEAAAQPSAGGDPTTVNGIVGKMVSGAGLGPGAAGGQNSVIDAARRLLEARQASAGNRLIAGMAQAGATAIGKGDAPGLRQLAANAEVPVQEAEKDVARMDRRGELDARSRAAVEAAKRALGQTTLGERRQTEMERHNRAMEARRGAGGGAAAEKRRQALEERQVGGLEFAPGRTPAKDDATKMKSTVERVTGILNDLERMSDVYARKGAEFGWGADLATSQGSREQVMLNLKELENLGVLQKLDVDSLSRIIPDPNSMRGALDKDGMRAQFDNFNRQLRDLVATKAGARGYAVTDPRLRGEGAAPRPAPDAQDKPAEVRGKDGRTYVLNPATGKYRLKE